MVHWDSSKGNKGSTMAERMTDYLLDMRRQRQAAIAAKLAAGYRPRLDERGNVILVKVKTEEA